jgi:hypothetical protein
MENTAGNANPSNGVQTTVARPKRRRCSMYKDEVVAENAALKIRVHELETRIRNFRELPTMRRIVFAIRGR